MTRAEWKKLTIEDFGNRICIIGPSSSGKSTLAQKISESIDVECFHLDQRAHIPNSNWKRRNNDDFLADHNEIIKKGKWIIEGNYSVCMPQRFERATSLIWLDPNLCGCVFRYVLRSTKNDPTRPGKLEGSPKEFNFDLIKYTLFNYPKNKRKYRQILSGYPDLLVCRISSMKELNLFYRRFGL